MKRWWPYLPALCAGLALAGCGGGSNSPSDSATATAGSGPDASEGAPGPEVVLPKGNPPTQIVVKDLRKGHGPEAERGDEATIQYVGKHWDGYPYSNSWTYPYAPTVTLGTRELARGLSTGIEGMRVGGRRRVLVPAGKVYFPGERHPPVDPQADALVFVVDLVGLQRR